MDKYFGLAIVLASWAAGFYLVTKWRGTRAMSISQHAASASAATTLFAAVLLAGGLGFYVWLISWFSAELQLTKLFTVLITLAFIGQVVAAIVPDNTGTKRIVHRVAAYSMAGLFLPLSVLILTAQHYSVATTVMGIGAIVYMLVAWYLFLFVKSSRQHYLVFQSLYIVSFQIIILASAYLR